MFRIRGGQKQRNSKPSQFQRKHTQIGTYVYIENGSKNNSGAELRVTNEVIPIRVLVRDICPVYLLDLYLSKLPRMAFGGMSVCQ